MQVVEISLELEINIPNDKIRFVTVYPSLIDRIADTGNGFQFDSQHSRDTQLNLIKKTFLLVKNHPSSENSAAHFLIFPELSVPEKGLQEIEDAMCGDWPINSVVMGGLEYIKGEKFKNLLNNSNNPDETKNLPDNINSLIVNTAFIYIKLSNNEVKKYYQAKMFLSPPEQRLQNAYKGTFVFLFKTSALVFSQVICFDVIAQSQQLENFAQSLLVELKKFGTSSRPLRVDLLFALQHNDNPNNDDFKNFTKIVLNGTRETQIDSVVFANSAAEKLGCSAKYGKSRFHFLTQKYQTTDRTVSDPPKTFSFKIEDTIKYAQFREDGPSVHSFEYIPPPAVSTFSGNNRYPFSNARMHKIYNNGSIETEGNPIDGLWKNIFDFLPEELPQNDPKNRWKASQCREDRELNATLKQKFIGVRNKLLINNLQISRLKEIMDLLFLGYNENHNRKKIENPDFWEDNYEGEGIKDLASGLTIFEILGNVKIIDSCLSGAHTALFNKKDMEFYLSFVDNPNDEMRQNDLKRKYNECINENIKVEWDKIDWRKNTLMLICAGNSNPSDELVERYKKYFSTSDSEEENRFPADLASNKQKRFTSIKDYGYLYTYSLDKLRGDLERDCSQIIPQWREKLEPLRS